MGSIQIRGRNFDIIAIHLSDAASPNAVFVVKDILHDGALRFQHHNPNLDTNRRTSAINLASPVPKSGDDMRLTFPQWRLLLCQYLFDR